MTTTEIITTAISFLALIVSAYAVYRTSISRFRGEVILKPRVVLTNFGEKPCVVVGFDMLNLGAISGSVDDFVLSVKYQQKNPKSTNSFSFLPVLIRDSYSVFEKYKREEDFENFHSIAIPKTSRVTKYIVFFPSDDNFNPSVGEMELQVHYLDSASSNYDKATRKPSYSINGESIDVWVNQPEKSVSLESKRISRSRDDLMDAIF